MVGGKEELGGEAGDAYGSVEEYRTKRKMYGFEQIATKSKNGQSFGD